MEKRETWKKKKIMYDILTNAIVEIKKQDALETAKKLLEEGDDGLKILDACSRAMEIVGKRFEEGEYFLPHLLITGNIFQQISEMIKPRLKQTENSKKKGTVLIGTVRGDVHDIGKNIVTFMLEVNGFEVCDIGIDVPPARFVEAIREHKPHIVGLSGLLRVNRNKKMEIK